MSPPCVAYPEHVVRVRATSLRLTVGAISLAAMGCADYATTVSARLVDPHLVSVETKTAAGVTNVVLPAGPSAAYATIPEDAAPYFRDGGSVTRDVDGTLTFRLEHFYDRQEPRRLVTSRGILNISGPVGDGDDIVRMNDSVFRTDYTLWSHYGRKTVPEYTVSLTTPWSNVVEVRERKTLTRSGGWFLLVLGTGAAILGTYFLASALFDDTHSGARDAKLFAGPLMLVTGGFMLSIGVFNAFFPEKERVLYPQPH